VVLGDQQPVDGVGDAPLAVVALEPELLPQMLLGRLQCGPLAAGGQAGQQLGLDADRVAADLLHVGAVEVDLGAVAGGPGAAGLVGEELPHDAGVGRVGAHRVQVAVDDRHRVRTGARAAGHVAQHRLVVGAHRRSGVHSPAVGHLHAGGQQHREQARRGRGPAQSMCARHQVPWSSRA
jgi:hypothetical protein